MFSKYAVILFLCLWGTESKAIKIEITKGDVRPDPIAIVNFQSDNSDLEAIGQDITTVVGNDLESSGLFELVPSASFIQDAQSLVASGPRFNDWRITSARFLVSGKVKREAGQKLTIEVRLFDVITGQQMKGVAVSGDEKKWRRIAHIIADEIYSRITNESGYFNTQIVFIESIGPRGKNQKKRIMRMDQDGASLENLTSGENLVLTPRYAPDGQKIAYLSFSKDSMEVYLLDLATKKKNSLGHFGEMNFAPRFSNDATTVVMSLIKGGKSAIYTYSLTAKKLTALTQHISIDTSPCFSPTSKEIVFTSDRDREGGEQIYVMDANGQNVRRISFGEGKYSQPVWSPRGDLIAFTKQLRGKFYIGVIAPDGTGERLIAEGYLVEGASWSPNGRYLIFSKEETSGAQSQIYKIDLTGRNMRAVKTPRDASDCAWSPLLG